MAKKQITLKLPKAFKTTFHISSKKDSPVWLFYRWLGAQLGFDWEDASNKYTIDVSEVCLSNADYRKLYNRLEDWIRKHNDCFAEKYVQSCSATIMFQYGPSTKLEGLDEGSVVVLPEWKVKKNRR